MVTIVVGLGNPGQRYRWTRHNIGFQVVDEMQRRAGVSRTTDSAQCEHWRSSFEGHDVVMAKPLLYMNRSGPAVRSLLKAEGGSVEDLLVVCDDFHIEFGVLRLRRQGSHGGHNGLRSIMDVLQTREFPRLRIGIGPATPGVDQSEFVLEAFAADERKRVPEVVGEAADCVEMVLRSGIERAMNRFNKRPGSAQPAPGQAAD